MRTPTGRPLPLLTARAAGGVLSLLVGARGLAAQAVAGAATAPAACVTADGGRMATALRTMQNASAGDARVVPAVELPAGWRLALGTEAMLVSAGSAATWVVGAVAPNGARAGDYTLPYVLRAEPVDGGEPSALVRGALCVRVPARVRADVRVAPLGVVVAGDTAHVTVLVRNTGNVPTSLRLRGRGVVSFAQAAPEFAVAVQMPRGPLALGPGDSAVVRVGVFARRSLPRSGSVRVEVAVSSDTSAATLASDVRDVLVVPPPARGLRRTPALPLRASLRAGGGRAVAPVELAGQGALGAQTRVEVLARGPAPADSPIGERSEYRLDVATPTRQLTLGDQTFALSPLLERGHGGFGAQGRASVGAVQLQAFADRNRWWRAGGTEAGGSATLRAPSRVPTGLFGMQALSRHGSARDDGTLASASGALGPEHARVELEAAGAHARRGADRAGWALRARASGRAPRGSYDVELSQANAAYPGYLRGAGTAAGEVRLDARRVELALSARDDHVGGGTLETPDLAIGALLLPRERRRAVAASARVLGVATVGLRAADRVGRAGTLSYEGSERSVALELSHRAGPLSLTVDGARGLRDDRRRALRTPFQRVAARVEVLIGRTLNGRLFAEREQGATLWSNAASSSGMGVDLSLEATPRTRVQLSAGTSARRALYDDAIPVDGLARARQIDATLEHRLPSEHALALRVRLASTDALLRGLGAQQSRLVYLEYRLPFGLRLPALRGPADLRVRVVDGATQRPVTGALVRRGDDVGLTGRDGVARLPGGAAGTVELLETPAVAAYAARAAAVPAAGAPVTLALLARGRLQGTATLGDSLAAGVRVMIAGARDTLFVMTDARGAFDAGALAPGRWQLLAAGVSAGGLATLATDSVDVASGATATVRLTLRTRARALRPLQVTSAPREPEALGTPMPVPVTRPAPTADASPGGWTCRRSTTTLTRASPGTGCGRP